MRAHKNNNLTKIDIFFLHKSFLRSFFLNLSKRFPVYGCCNKKLYTFVDF